MIDSSHGKVVDVHAHLLPRSAIAAAESGAEWFGSRIETDSLGRPEIVTGDYRVSMGGPAHWESIEQRITKMDAIGVDRQVISLNPILFRYYLDSSDAIECSKAVNDEIAGIVADRPDRFAGFGTLPMQDVGAAMKELERVMSTKGMVGVSVGTHVGGLNWDEPDLFPILEAAEQSGGMVFIHPAASRLKEALPRYHLRNFIANPTETTIAIGSLIFGGILDRLPALRLLLAHGGGYACWAYARFDHGHEVRAEARNHIARLPSDYLSSMWYDSLVHGYGNLRRLVDVVGIDRVVLGTDFPADMGQPDPVSWIEGSDLSTAEKDAVLGSNAEVMLPW
ncbi:MAG TPA: amidohydrolase family protein [Acidimicrobiia bacterium]|nr:amidohydrolase family protein [Acidimicrobiia bacterium]